eukprot:CAMPEP_0201525676 /NCGR_PEP_ID=MMETSP0161_2-20130828/29151_1 /ASSEMBLY_ACC=CAM_ASM_000251 /TAXON_ID=180227 /ORGANISM="Neoparamoeba aestuarina, Strain SoJaBio B1-5/56/2" /LENGTH=55 /DNA_ID=CAMNT_0047925729 /DNA_START=103 /DNA_END=267 /DNA_ORIENTATION=-
MKSGKRGRACTEVVGVDIVGGEVGNDDVGDRETFGKDMERTEKKRREQWWGVGDS